MSENSTVAVNPTAEKISKYFPFIVILILIILTILLWEPVSLLLAAEDAEQLQAQVDQLGIMAPIAYFCLSVIQIVGAPIPGYPVQLLGGALFGPWLGGIYAIVGMLAGGLLAAWLARTLGRPFIEKQISAETLDKYEGLAKLESLWLWVIILIIPLGDFPYYIAGLSRVKFTTLALAILIARGPFTFVITWVGYTSVDAPPWVFWTIVVAVLAFVAIGFALRNHISRFIDRHLLHRLN